MENNLHAFRVRLSSGITPTVSIDDTHTQQYHTRRAHTKSRQSCEYCKERRRKCDEQKPTCSLCEKAKKECLYARNTVVRPSFEFKPATQVVLRGPLSRKNMPLLSSSLWPGPRSPAFLAASSSTSSISQTKYDLELLDHFFNSTGSYFNATGMPGLDSPITLGLAKQYPYIMHGMIALAACHLQQMGIDGRRYRIS
ncbi:hypothetical protein P280DRAFT_133570 [Massarina eburnea CBS 473.64]|uniref:Zn(2)-C6 fungal-type domain-containing protein n=1 Tax=Massarina eburnea CBS 473.64 TaxID=1395130 RepID=A0A6A6SH06_9PLEO|nr:hypothetical protein P280DRAFT_133570 [Massarina eburnea CBS 473.64]